MIHDSKAKFVIASEKEIGRLKESNCEFIDINILENNCDEFQDIEDINDSMDIANIIYTSGSTGNPKGVCVRHKNIIRLFNNNKCFQFKNTDRMLQTGSIAFDASTWEIWGTLLNGATLYIEDNNIAVSYTHLDVYKRQQLCSYQHLYLRVFHLKE